MTDLLSEAWHAVASRPMPRLACTGSADRLRSRLRVPEAAVAAVGAALAAASALSERRDGARSLAPSLHRSHVAAAVVSERLFGVDGAPAGASFAPLSRFWQTSDGWVRTHANYPWHREALLAALGRGDGDPDQLGRAISERPAEEVEESVVAAGGVAAAVRTLEQWSRHPQGRAVAAEPLVGHRVLHGAPPRERSGGELPASGVRVLDLTRVIAGPVCTRLLGALGADVLRLDPPHRPDMAAGAVADTLLGKRSARLDLRERRSRDVLEQLLAGADVLVCGYRPGSLDRFGLGADELAGRHPGLVVVQLCAWGHSGPWADRRGFDSVVQGPTGLALAESDDGSTPGALPCQLLDHATGYLAAAAVLDGLGRQGEEGGTQLRRLSLARTAHWLAEAGKAGRADLDGGAGDAGDRAADEGWVVRFPGPEPVSAVAPPGSLGGEPLRWAAPPSRYGADAPAWEGPSR